MPRKGFRFVGEVREAGDVPSARTARATVSATKLVALDDDVTTGMAGQCYSDVVIEERKLVTVLCADVKQPLELIAERDPEQAMRSFDAVLELMTQAVNRYEGRINVVTSDGIMGLLGAPIDHADNAVHAC